MFHRSTKRRWEINHLSLEDCFICDVKFCPPHRELEIKGWIINVWVMREYRRENERDYNQS